MAETSGLLNRHRGKLSVEGSNPSLSATLRHRRASPSEARGGTGGTQGALQRAPSKTAAPSNVLVLPPSAMNLVPPCDLGEPPRAQRGVARPGRKVSYKGLLRSQPPPPSLRSPTSAMNLNEHPCDTAEPPRAKRGVAQARRKVFYKGLLRRQPPLKCLSTPSSAMNLVPPCDTAEPPRAKRGVARARRKVSYKGLLRRQPHLKRLRTPNN